MRNQKQMIASARRGGMSGPLALTLGAMVAAGLAFAQTPPRQIATPQAIELYQAGKIEEATAAFQEIMVRTPDDRLAIYYSSLLDIKAGRYTMARPRVERLVRLYPSFVPAWELMVQIYQALEELRRRDDAIWQLRAARDSSADGDARGQRYFIRDRFTVEGRRILGLENLTPGGGTYLHYVFMPEEEETKARHLIVLAVDEASNERWRDSGMLPDNKVMYQISTIDNTAADGSGRVLFAYYLDIPDYDTVRAKVIEIAGGRAKPLSPEPEPFWARGVR